MITPLAFFVAFIAIGVPIAFALGSAALIGLWLLQGLPIEIVASRTFGAIDSFTLLAIPFFITAGQLMEVGGISTRLVAFSRSLVGHIRGGLGNVVVVSMIFFAGISGSTNADAAAVGSVMIPPMRRHGYKPGQATAIVAAAAGMGAMVPPCLTIVVYGSITNTSVATLFAAGLAPALIMAIALMVQIRLGAGRDGIEPEPRASWAERWAALKDASWALALPLIIFGGILGGIFTPTEAAVIAVVYAILVGAFVYREITPRVLYGSLVRSGVASGTIMFMIAEANVFAWLMTVQGVPAALASTIEAIGGGQEVFLILSIVVFVPLFAVLDGLPGMLMVTPVFIPIARQLGVDLILYGILMAAVMGVSLFLPPFGVGLYVLRSISGASMAEIARHLLPYQATLVVITLIVVLFPAIIFVLPQVFGLYSPVPN